MWKLSISGQILSFYSYWTSPRLCVPWLFGSMTSPRKAALGVSSHVYPCSPGRQNTLEQAEILQWQLPCKCKVFLWLRFALCLGTDSTSHFLGLWDRLLLQHSFLPPNTCLKRNHFLLASCSGHRNLFKLSLTWKKSLKSTSTLLPLRDCCLVTPNHYR